MSLPWNVVNEKNIYFSHQEFMSKISVIKPLYENPDQITITIPSILPLIIFNIIFVMFIILSFKIFYLISISLLPLSYLLGLELSKNVSSKMLTVYIVLFSILFINTKIGLVTVISILLVFYIYFTHRKSKYAFAFSATASNLIYEFSVKDSYISVLKSDLRLSPYKMYLELVSNNSGILFHDFITIYAINKGRVGIIIEVEYYVKDMRNKKFKELLNTHFDLVKSFLISKLNEKEWILG
ncbi:hypothetical protein [Sulfurisphaera ohwakuensis]|uniref:hypothetical protein n=1 Tax=Sulfurisphaera ohwakuensis TaxID=69656 RepID=UPI0036F27465